MAILQEYQKIGLRARLGLILFFFDRINKNLENPSKDPKQEMWGWNDNHNLAILDRKSVV